MRLQLASLRRVLSRSKPRLDKASVINVMGHNPSTNRVRREGRCGTEQWLPEVCYEIAFPDVLFVSRLLSYMGTKLRDAMAG